MTSDIVGTRLSSISLSPNPISTGSACLISVGITEIRSRLYTLSSSSWSGSGPYTQTLAVDSDITPTAEFLVYGDHAMTVAQRLAEYNALLRAEVVASGRVEFTALSIKPDVDIPVRIIAGVLPTMRNIVVPASSWSGSGPWTAQIGVGVAIQTAACAPSESSSASSAESFYGSAIHVSGVSGATITLRAMLAKPDADITLGVMAL